MPKQSLDGASQAQNQTKKHETTRYVEGRIPFPRNSLKETLKIAETIERENAGDSFDPILLAKALGTTQRASSYATLLTSSERYGLTTGGPKANGIELTPLGKDVVRPTEESRLGVTLREALLKPDLFKEVYNKYNKHEIPKEEFLKATLERVYKVPRADLDSAYRIIMQNVKDYNLILDMGKSSLLWLDNLGKADAAQSIQAATVGERVIEAEAEDVETLTPSQEQVVQAKPAEIVPRVFISHSKNKVVVAQIKEMLGFGNFQSEVAEDRQTLAIPISEKVFGLMEKCNCAIINISADEEKKEGEGDQYSINENVLTEIGAAYLHYDRRVILLIDERLKDKLPSNIKQLAAIFYQGNELSWSAATKLQKALSEFRTALQNASQ